MPMVFGVMFDQNDLMEAVYVGVGAAALGYLMGMPYLSTVSSSIPLPVQFGLAGAGGYLGSQFIVRMQASA